MPLKPQSRIMRIKIRHGIISPSLAHSRGSDTASWCGGVFDERIMERPHHGIHVAESLGAESWGHIRHGHSSRQTNKCASEVHVRTMDQAYTCHDRNIVRWAESKEQQQPTLVTKCGHGFLIHANENNETTQWCNTCNHVIMIMMMDIPSLIAHTERTVRQCPACFHNTCKWSSMSNATHADDLIGKRWTRHDSQTEEPFHSSCWMSQRIPKAACIWLGQSQMHVLDSITLPRSACHASMTRNIQ